jgi:hypothetical protein
LLLTPPVDLLSRTARTVFRPNETHRQQDLFGLETQLSPELRKRLHGSKEYAFYTEIFCRIPEALFAELYDEDPPVAPTRRSTPWSER